MLSSLAHSSLALRCSYRLKFFVAKNHLSSSLSNCSLLDSRFLDHVQHALLKGLSTQGVWRCACAYALLSRDLVGSASKKKRMPLRTEKQARASKYFNPLML